MQGFKKGQVMHLWLIKISEELIKIFHFPVFCICVGPIYLVWRTMAKDSLMPAALSMAIRWSCMSMCHCHNLYCKLYIDQKHPYELYTLAAWWHIICCSELGHHWIRYWPVPCLAISHYTNKFWHRHTAYSWPVIRINFGKIWIKYKIPM